MKAVFFGVSCLSTMLLIVVAAVDEPIAQSQAVMYGIPEGTPLNCGHFVVAVDGATRGPRWVIERLTAGEFSRADRTGMTFRADDRIPKEFRVIPKDYVEPVYDIGHMAPAANGRTPSEVKATFILSNAWPQTHEFNAGIWLNLEKEVRNIASKNETFVLSAPIWNVDFDYKVDSIGTSKVRIPPAFGKSVLILSGQKFEMRSWIIPHREASRRTLNDYRVTADEFERLSGLDVWSKLPKDIQDRLESSL